MTGTKRLEYFAAASMPANRRSARQYRPTARNRAAISLEESGAGRLCQVSAEVGLGVVSIVNR